MRVLALLIATLLACGCICDSSPSTEEGPSLDGITLYPNRPIADDSVLKSDAAVLAAAAALKKGDGPGFTSMLSKELRVKVSTNADWRSKDAQELGDALGKAKIVEKSADLMVYEMTYSGRTQRFFVKMEADKWKLDGL